MAVIRHGGNPLVVSAGTDRTVRVSHVWDATNTLAALRRPNACSVQVRHLELGSLEVVLLIPLGLLTGGGLAVSSSPSS